MVVAVGSHQGCSSSGSNSAAPSSTTSFSNSSNSSSTALSSSSTSSSSSSLSGLPESVVQMLSPVPNGNFGTGEPGSISAKVRIVPDPLYLPQVDDVTAVEANGISLSRSENDIALWNGVITVDPGENTLQILVKTAQANATRTIQFNNGQVLTLQGNLLVDETSNRLITLETGLQLLAMDLTTGEITKIADGEAWGVDGPTSHDAQMTWVSSQESIYFFDLFGHRLSRYDLASDSMQIVWQRQAGSEPNVGRLTAMTFERSTNKFYLLDQDLYRVLELDPAIGALSIAYEADAEQDPANIFSFTTDLVASDTHFYIRAMFNRIYALEKSTGTITLMFNASPVAEATGEVTLAYHLHSPLALNDETGEIRIPAYSVADDRLGTVNVATQEDLNYFSLFAFELQDAQSYASFAMSGNGQYYFSNGEHYYKYDAPGEDLALYRSTGPKQPYVAEPFTLVHSNNSLLTYTSDGVYEFDVNAGVATLISPQGLPEAGRGGLFSVTSDNASIYAATQNMFWSISRESGQSEQKTLSMVINPNNSALDTGAGIIVTMSNDGSIHTIDLQTLAMNSQSIDELLDEANSSVYGIFAHRELGRFWLQTGAREFAVVGREDLTLSLVARVDDVYDFSGSFASSKEDICFFSDEEMYVIESTTADVITGVLTPPSISRYTPGQGLQAISIADDQGDGYRAVNIVELECDAANNQIIAYDAGLDALISIDTDSGDRMILAR